LFANKLKTFKVNSDLSVNFHDDFPLNNLFDISSRQRILADGRSAMQAEPPLRESWRSERDAFETELGSGERRPTMLPSESEPTQPDSSGARSARGSYEQDNLPGVLHVPEVQTKSPQRLRWPLQFHGLKGMHHPFQLFETSRRL